MGKKIILKIISWFFFLSYSYFLFYCLFLGFYRSRLAYTKPLYNLIPFKSIGYFIRILSMGFYELSAINILGNIILFIPLGFIFPILFKKMIGFKYFSIIFISIIAIIEITQLISRRGMADIDDLLLNYIGGCIGFLFFKFVQKRLPL